MNPNDHDAAARRAAKLCKIQKQLDEALAATFPASDPVAIVTSQMEEDWLEEEPEKDLGRGKV